MKEKSLVSIAVAIYKVEEFLEQCIQSLTKQTYKNIEILLVDDGSPDRCPQICDQAAQKDKRIKVIHKKNGGIVSARTAGLEATCGKYMILLDGDDWVDPDWIATLVHSIEESNTDLAIGQYCLTYADHEVDIPYKLSPGIYEGNKLTKLKESALFDIEKFSYGTISPSVWNKLFLREKLLNIYTNMPIDLTLGEDFAVVMPYVYKCKAISFVNSLSRYHYRQRVNSMVRAYNPRLVNNIYNLRNYLYSLEWSDSFRNQLDYYFAKMTIYAVKNQLGSGKHVKERRESMFEVYKLTEDNDFLSRINEHNIPLKSRIILWAIRKKHVTLLFALRIFYM